MLPDRVKKLFDIIRKRLRLFVFGWLLLMVAVLSWRLAAGPIRIDGIKPIIVSRLESTLPGTHASIRHLDLVWFGDARAVGFRFEELMIRDSRNRIIASAGRMETALAADSLVLMHFAPARLTAQDFYMVASVSKEGRYDLGFEAHGTPGKGEEGLDRFLYDLTGREKLGQPVSFTRQISLKDGELRLIQEGGALDWTARVATIDFSKLHNKLESHIDLTIAGSSSQAGSNVASLKVQANGVVGLKQAAISANLHGLVPADIFPSVGITRKIAVIDAPVDGLARIDYSIDKGFQGAWLDIDAGAGHVTFGGTQQDFDGARIKATYRSADHTAQFETFQLRSNLLDTDLSGKVTITPQDRAKKRDLRIAFDFSGPRLTGRLADDFARQTLTNAHFKGAYTPQQRRLDIETGTGLLNGAPFDSQGAVFSDEKGQLGTDLTAHIRGRFSKDEVFAFWPEDLSPILRGDLIRRIKGGDFANADFVMKAPVGHFEPFQMKDEDLRLDFDFSHMSLGIEKRMHDAGNLAGHGILKGNSFAMDVTGGQLDDVVLTKGALMVPSFQDHSTSTHIWLESTSTAVAVIEAVDPLTGGELGTHGLNADRLAGDAQVHVDITFPTFKPINNSTFGVTFKGQIVQAGLKQAALGWDLSEGSLTITGDLLADRLVVTGPARLGPYTGDVSYRTQFMPKTQLVDFKGSFNAAQFGGSPRVPVAITGQFTMADGKGEGTVDSDIFRGNVTWSGDPAVDQGRPTQVVIEGVTLGLGMEAQGLPIFERLKRELPTRISLLRSGEIWAGEVDAESLSGDLAYIQGQRPRMVYKSIITPDEASELGFGGLPVFNQPRHLTVNVALDSESKEALVKLDDLNAVLGWSEVAGSDELLRRMKMTVRPEDWVTLGLPVAFFKPVGPTEVTALWQQASGHLLGKVSLLGQVVDFDMPSRESVAANADDPYGLRIHGHVTDQVLAALGYNHDPVEIAGDVAFAFSLYDAPGHPAGVVNIDAGQAALGVKATDWHKPVGEVAQFAVSLDNPAPDGADRAGVNLSRIYGTGDRIRIDGRAAFDADSALEFADFSDIYLRDFMDVSYKYYAIKDGDSDVVAISGKQLDLRPWLKGSDDVPAAKPAAGDRAATPDVTKAGATRTANARPVHLVVDLEQLRLSADGAFTRLALDVNWDGRNGIDGQGSAMTADAKPLAVTFKSQGGYSLFSLTTNDLGSVVRTASGQRNLWGGEAVIEGAYMDGQVDASLKGEHIRVKQIPVLAQLLTVASLEGAADTLTGEGIAFSDFEFPVRYRDHRLFINDGWAKGGALGISVRGTTDFDAKTVDFSGTLIPAYRVNAMFGDLGSNGLGLLGLKYGLKGGYKAPVVAVDPLSLIMPGFIKVWERDQGKPPIEALNLPSVKDRLAQIREENEARLKN